MELQIIGNRAASGSSVVEEPAQVGASSLIARGTVRAFNGDSADN
jgi:hypothetical protein